MILAAVNRPRVGRISPVRASGKADSS